MENLPQEMACLSLPRPGAAHTGDRGIGKLQSTLWRLYIYYRVGMGDHRVGATSCNRSSCCSTPITPAPGQVP